MTRARLQLTLVGNPQLLAHNTTFSQLMQYSRSQGAFLQVDTECFCRGDFEVQSRPDGLSAAQEE